MFCCTSSTALLKELTPRAAEKDGSRAETHVSCSAKCLFWVQICQTSLCKMRKGNTISVHVSPCLRGNTEHVTHMWVSYQPCSRCVVPKAWTTASSSTSKPLREKKLAGTSCCESPTRSWRIWECPGSAIRNLYWRLWTYSVLWWVLGAHPAFPFQSFSALEPPSEVSCLLCKRI